MQEVLVSKIFNYASTPTKNVEGQFWFNPSTNVLSRFNGTIWKPITVSSDDVAVLTDGSKVSLTSYLNTQIAALAEGIDSKQDKLETYKEKQGDEKIDTRITSSLKENGDSGKSGDITIWTQGASTSDGGNTTVPTSGNIILSTGDLWGGSTGGGNIEINTGSEVEFGLGASIKLNSGHPGAPKNPGDIMITSGGSAGIPGKININAIGSTQNSEMSAEPIITISTEDRNSSSGGTGDILIKSGNITGPLGTGNGGQISIGGGQIETAAQGGNIDITAGSATGENSTSGRIKLNVPDKSGIVIAKDFIELNYKGDTSTNPGYNEWKCYIGGSGSKETTDFNASKYSIIYLGNSDYATEINLGGGNSYATVNIGTTSGINSINIGSGSDYDTLTLDCGTLSGRTFNTELTSTSDNNHIPTSKAVYDALTLKQDTLQFYTESITPSGSGIYKEQISLGKNNYSQTINIGGNSGFQIINLGGSSASSGRITIGTTGNNNQIQIGRDNTSTALEINAVTVNGAAIDKTELTESSNKLPTSQAVLNELSSKQNATDNSLETTDKTIVGAINELSANKQNTLKYFSESDSSTVPSSNNAQVSILKSSDYQTTLNLGFESSNGIQTINIGGSSNTRNINIGPKVCGENNNVTIGNASDGVLLTLNTGRGLAGTGVTKDLSTSATDAQFPTAAAVNNQLILKQNITDNTLTTADKTIVGAINEINSIFNVNTLLAPITDVKTITTTLENLITDTQYANKPGTILINPAITNTGAILVGEAITDISKAFPIYTDQPVTIAFKNINDFKVAGNIAGDKFNYIVSFGYIGNTNIVSNNLKITTTNGVYESTPEGDSESTTLKISKIS